MWSVLDGAVNKRDLSTEKSESPTKKRGGPNPTPGVLLPLRESTSQTRELESGENYGMWGIPASGGEALLSIKTGVGVRNKNIWLNYHLTQRLTANGF